jgi:hypothetical protein
MMIRLVLSFVLGFAIMGGIISCSETMERHGGSRLGVQHAAS